MNTSPVTVATVTVAPSAFDLFLAAEAAAWDEYEADLAVEKDVRVSLNMPRPIQWRLDRAANALGAALAVAHAEYESATQVTQATQVTARPVFPAAALSLCELESSMLAAPYGDEFAALVAEWQGRLEWEAALLARVVTGDDGLDHYL